MLLSIPLILFGLSHFANGCNLCAAPASSPLTDCPSGSLCDSLLVTKQSLPTGCIRYRCSTGNMLAKTSTNLQRQVDYLWCSTNKAWYDNQNRTGYSSVTCVLPEEDKQCSHPPLPEPIPEGYKVMGAAVYNKTSRVLKCTVPTAVLITQSKIGLGTKPDGCLHVESAMCADIFKCDTTFASIDKWPVQSWMVYSSPPVVNMQDFTASCPNGKNLMAVIRGIVYHADSFSAKSAELNCQSGKWSFVAKTPTSNVSVEIDGMNAGCFAQDCPPIEESSTCGEGKECTKAEYVNTPAGGEYKCPTGSKLVFVSNGQTKVGTNLTCGRQTGSWSSGGVAVTECSAVRCETDKCPELAPIDQNAVFTRDYKGLPMVREDEERYSCPSVVYESSLQKYVDYSYDVYKAGKYVSCSLSGQKWGWRSDDGTAIASSDRVFCALKNCQFCVSQALTEGCDGYDKPYYNKSLINDCSVSFFNCANDKVLRTTDQGPDRNFKLSAQAFTCQSANWNTYKATYGVGTAKTVCCTKPMGMCELIDAPTTCAAETFECKMPTSSTVTYTISCPTGYGFFDKTTFIPEKTAKCNEIDQEWYTPTGKILSKTAKVFCKKI